MVFFFSFLFSNVRDFQTEEELAQYANSIEWSETKDDDDFSADDSDSHADYD